MTQSPDTMPARRDGKLQTCLNDAPGNLALHRSGLEHARQHKKPRTAEKKVYTTKPDQQMDPTKGTKTACLPIQ